MKTTLNKPARWLHRLGAVITLLPFGVVLVTGIILQVKKQWTWVQPPTAQGTIVAPTVSFDRLLASAQTVPEADISTWDDVDRVDVRPGKGIAKVRAKNRWEIQVDTATGEILHVAFRRSDLIESIHDGSWFHDLVKTWLFLPSAVIVFLLWLSGIYLWLLPGIIRRRRRKA